MPNANIAAVDVGTTHCKAAVFTPEGRALRIARRPTPVRREAGGRSVFDAEELWAAVASALREALGGSGPIAALGIAGMAETGLPVDRRTGAPRSPFQPWFDAAAAPQMERIERATDPAERFHRSGLRPSFKYGLAKILWLQEQNPDILHSAVWLSVPDYVAFRLTGEMATDPTLAARTYAWDMGRMEWDAALLAQFGLAPSLFPRVLPSGGIVGATRAGNGAGITEGVPVGIAGHDHLCAAVAAGAAQPGAALDSMGTAETLIGAVDALHIGERERASGLAFGRHALPGRWFWLGGLPASGGSVEWLRQLLWDEPPSYAALETLANGAGEGPTGILYVPYLIGSGAPRPNAAARGAFLGLGAGHGRAHMAKAVLEGTAYEMEAIRRAAEAATGRPVTSLIAVGGGARNATWLQIKADVSGLPVHAPALPEAALWGAALLAAAGAGMATDAAADIGGAVFTPNAERRQAYQTLFDEGYPALQDMVRGAGSSKHPSGETS